MKSTVKSRYRWPSNVASIVIGTLGALAFTGCGDDDTTIIIDERDSGLDAGATGGDSPDGGDTDTSSEPTSQPTDTQPDPTGGETDGGVPTDTDTTSGETSSPTDTDDTSESTDTSEPTDTSDDDPTVIIPDGGTGNNDPDAAVGAGEATQPPDNATLVLTTFANPGTKSNDGAGILMTGAKEESDPADIHELAGFAVANSIATFEAVFTGQVQSYRVQLPTTHDATNQELVVRLRVLSSLETDGANPAIQLAAWSGGWQWTDTYTSINDNAYEWVEYRLDMDTVADPAALNAVGFQITTGGSELDYPEPDSVTFQVDWVAFVPKAVGPDAGPDGGFDAGPDGGWDDDDAGWDDDAGVPDGGGDAGVDGGDELTEVGEDPPDDAIFVVTDMDGELASGYNKPEGSLGAETKIEFYNSIARFTTPFTEQNEDFRVYIETNETDWSGYDLAIRFRIRSGLVAGTYPGLQLYTWDTVGSDHRWISIDGNKDYSDWAVYRAAINDYAKDPTTINAVGFAVHTGGTGSGFEDMVYEVDWIAIVPSEDE